MMLIWSASLQALCHRRRYGQHRPAPRIGLRWSPFCRLASPWPRWPCRIFGRATWGRHPTTPCRSSWRIGCSYRRRCRTNSAAREEEVSKSVKLPVQTQPSSWRLVFLEPWKAISKIKSWSKKVWAQRFWANGAGLRKPFRKTPSVTINCLT